MVAWVTKLPKLTGRSDIFFQFRNNKRMGYNLNVTRQSACLVFNQIMVDSYASFVNFMPMDRASDSMMALILKLFILVGWDRSFLSVAWPIGVQMVFFVCS